MDALPGPRREDAFLFPKNAGRRSPYNIVACWHTVRADAKLGRLRLHDLRHTAASHAIMSGRTCRWWANCSAIGATRRQQAMPTLPMRIWSKPLTKSVT